MSMQEPSPALRLRRYSEGWWGRWRRVYATVRYRYAQKRERTEKLMLRRLRISAAAGMAYYVGSETGLIVREKVRRVLWRCGRKCADIMWQIRS